MMDYAAALATAKGGQPVIRPHWHWVILTWLDGYFTIVHDDGKLEPWQSAVDDRNAKDWQVAPPDMV